jgi:hypothetical protein
MKEVYVIHNYGDGKVQNWVAASVEVFMLHPNVSDGII